MGGVCSPCGNVHGGVEVAADFQQDAKVHDEPHDACHRGTQNESMVRGLERWQAASAELEVAGNTHMEDVWPWQFQCARVQATFRFVRLVVYRLLFSPHNLRPPALAIFSKNTAGVLQLLPRCNETKARLQNVVV